MRKSFVFLLLALAVVVLVSPGIVGRLAEQTMDENLDWAASESSDIDVRSQGFDRGWFSSAGQHRIEVRAGELKDLLVAVFEPEDPDGLPALLIDTQLDHGLIPLTSMTREQGSLLPGLGNAVSTLTVEFPNGERFPVPGTIYSHVGLTGELTSNYLLEAGSFEADGGTLTWGQTDIRLTSNPSSGRVAIEGELAPLSAEAPEMTLLLDSAKFAVDQVPTRFGLAVGEIDVELMSVSMVGDGQSVSVGPLRLRAGSDLDGERLSAHVELTLENAPLEPFGTGSISTSMRLDGADAAAFARLQRSIQDAIPNPDPTATQALLDADVRQLIGAGFDFRIAPLEIVLPSGTIAITSRLDIAETDPDRFSWAALLLAADAAIDVSLPVEVMDLLLSVAPEVQTAIALGYLRRDGDRYVVEASLEDGTVRINGAPMQLPMGSFR